MLINNIALSPSLINSKDTFRKFISVVNMVMNNTIIFTNNEFIRQLSQEIKVKLNANFQKEFDSLLSQYKKVNKCCTQEDQVSLTICKLNKELHKKGINVLYSGEELVNNKLSNCRSRCFMINETAENELKLFFDRHIKPPDLDIYLKEYDNESLLKNNVYLPLLRCVKEVELVDIFIGENLVKISQEEQPDDWLDAEDYVYNIKMIHDIMKNESICGASRLIIHTTIVNRDEIALKKAMEQLKKTLLKDTDIEIKLKAYCYRGKKGMNLFSHERYVMSKRISIQVGIGLDTVSTKNKRIRRASIITVINDRSVRGIKKDLKNFPDNRNRQLGNYIRTYII